MRVGSVQLPVSLAYYGAINNGGSFEDADTIVDYDSIVFNDTFTGEVSLLTYGTV